MTTIDRPATVRPTIPRPRSPEPEEHVVLRVPAPVARYPWPEPWRHWGGARPRSEFWDVATASWHSSGPYPRQD
ncbi:MAG TPA: hypothetical protein VGN47_15470 [Blastococcus sp.]|jgi:hypothetical protein|nr:hypothetical protein [Blastococcus sp.]